MICPHCGQWAPEQALRCPHCQQPLDYIDAPTISSTDWRPTDGATTPEWSIGGYPPGPPPPPVTRRPAPSGGMYMAFALIAVGAIGLLVFTLMAGNVLDPHSNTALVVPTSTATFTPTPTMTATPSPTATTAVTTPSVAISAGGQGSGNFSGDMDYRGGTTDATNATIDTSQVTNPAPQSVYQSERWGDFTYTIPNLTPGTAYTVRLHFAEIYFQNPGQRLFNVAINGQQVLAEFDIVAAAGGANKAIVKEFPTNADPQGQITIAFTQGSANNPKISGIEIVPAA